MRIVIERILADVVLVVHLGFVLFVAFGGLLAFRWRWVPAAQIPAAIWGVFIEVSGGICPLTPLENALRQAAGTAGYSGGFIEHYLVPLIYPSFLTWPVQLVLAGAVVGLNIAIYLSVWRFRHRSEGLAA